MSENNNKNNKNPTQNLIKKRRRELENSKNAKKGKEGKTGQKEIPMTNVESNFKQDIEGLGNQVANLMGQVATLTDGVNGSNSRSIMVNSRLQITIDNVNKELARMDEAMRNVVDDVNQLVDSHIEVVQQLQEKGLIDLPEDT